MGDNALQQADNTQADQIQPVTQSQSGLTANNGAPVARSPVPLQPEPGSQNTAVEESPPRSFFDGVRASKGGPTDRWRDVCGTTQRFNGDIMVKQDGLLLFRTFDKLHIRAILYQQMELSGFEYQLHTIDQQASDSRSMPKEKALEAHETRKHLMMSIKDALNNYDELLAGYQSISAFQKAGNIFKTGTTPYEGMRYWKLLESYASEFNRADLPTDFFSLTEPRMQDRMQRAIGKMASRLTIDLFRHRHERKVDEVSSKIRSESKPSELESALTEERHPAQLLKRLDEEIDQSGTYQRFKNVVGSTAQIAAGLFTISVIIAIIIAPVGIMLRYDPLTDAKALGTIAGFSILFTLVFLLVTHASRQEAFSATAGYVAILVVFLVNLIPESTKKGEKGCT